MSKSMSFCAIALLGLCALTPSVLAGAEVGSPAEVAAKAEGTRCQLHAGAAWAEESKCWLLAWREGFLNEKVSDIWCARVAADGKALDPAGIRLTSGKGLKDNPTVASDGKDFLVVWEDLSGGKDWDVRGARVSGAGKLLDEKGLVVAGGEHNQARPAVAFAAGNYWVFWQGLTGTNIPLPGTGYGIYGARVSRDGKVLDAPAVAVAPVDKNLQYCWPAAAARGDDVLVGFTGLTFNKWGGAVALARVLDGKTGQTKTSCKLHDDARAYHEGPVTVAMGNGDGLLVSLGNYPPEHIGLMRVAVSGEQKKSSVEAPLGLGAFAFDGGRYLTVVARKTAQSAIRGWYLGDDGKPIDDPKTGFVVSADPAKDQIDPAVAAGPKGACLVAYSEVRGVDDVKILARIVK